MKIKYIAEDGTEFDREDLCAEYEERQNETLQDKADSIIGAYIKNKKGAMSCMTSAEISEMENEAKMMLPFNLASILLYDMKRRLYVRSEVVDILIDRIWELEDETQEVL
jgi:hypothetical protein|nr:MAG TPA: centrosomal protein [Caudoviricetes sp.]